MDAAAPSLPSTVDTDRPCIRCGYSLRGLPTTAACPECATPVQRSLMGDLLFYSDPAYVAMLRRGATAAIVSLCLVLGLTVGGGVLRVSFSLFPIVSLVVTYSGLAVDALFALAWWWLTTPDAGQLTENKGERPRRIARLCMLSLLAVKAVSLALPFVVPLSTPARSALDTLDTLVLGVGLIAGMKYLLWLSPRLPNYVVYKGAEQLRVVLIVTTSLYAVRLLLTLATALFGIPARFAGRPFAGMMSGAGLGLVSFVAGLMGLVSFIMFWTLFSRLRTNLAKLSAEQARQGLLVG